MITRRQVVGSAFAAGGTSAGGALLLGLHGCGAPAVVSAAASGSGAANTTTTVVAAVATTVAAISDIVVNTFTAKAAQAEKEKLAVLAPSATTHPGRPIASKALPDDTLARLDQIQSDLKSIIALQKPPVLPGRPAAETWYRLEPVIWEGGRPIAGAERMVHASEFPSRFTLFSPDFEAYPIARPGLYRVGYRLTSEAREGELLAGGPFLHVFSSEAWNYDNIIAEYARPRPEYLANLTYPVDPSNDVDYLNRTVTV